MALDETSSDLPFLWDMREAGLGLIRLTRFVSYEEFSSDVELVDAVERGLTIIGQAARLVSIETRDALPDVPWRDFIGMARLLSDAADALEPAELWKAVGPLTAMVSSVSRLMPVEDDASV